METTAPESNRGRSHRNALACSAGLGLVWLALVLSAPDESSFQTLVVESGLIATAIALGPFSGRAVTSTIPESIFASIAVLAWGSWLLAVAKGWLRPLPWIMHLLLPILWCAVGALVGAMASLSIT